jgi:hypothetical protein
MQIFDFIGVSILLDELESKHDDDRTVNCRGVKDLTVSRSMIIESTESCRAADPGVIVNYVEIFQSFAERYV